MLAMLISADKLRISAHLEDEAFLPPVWQRTLDFPVQAARSEQGRV